MSRLNMLLTKKMAEVAWRTFLDAHDAWQKASGQYMSAKSHADTACQKARHAYDVEARAKAEMNLAQQDFYAAMTDRIKAEFNLEHNVVSPAPLAAKIAVLTIRTVEDRAYATFLISLRVFYTAMVAQKKAYLEWGHLPPARAPLLAATKLAEKNRNKANTALWVAETAHRKARAAYLELPANSADRRLLRKVHLKYIAVPTAVTTAVPTTVFTAVPTEKEE